LWETTRTTGISFSGNHNKPPHIAIGPTVTPEYWGSGGQKGVARVYAKNKNFAWVNFTAYSCPGRELGRGGGLKVYSADFGGGGVRWGGGPPQNISGARAGWGSGIKGGETWLGEFRAPRRGENPTFVGTRQVLNPPKTLSRLDREKELGGQRRRESPTTFTMWGHTPKVGQNPAG